MHRRLLLPSLKWKLEFLSFAVNLGHRPISLDAVLLGLRPLPPLIRRVCRNSGVGRHRSSPDLPQFPPGGGAEKAKVPAPARRLSREARRLCAEPHRKTGDWGLRRCPAIRRGVVPRQTDDGRWFGRGRGGSGVASARTHKWGVGVGNDGFAGQLFSSAIHANPWMAGPGEG